MEYFVPFLNRPLDKKKLSALLLWVRFNCGEREALNLVENLKSLGFSTATHFALSLGIEDLTPPRNKNEKVILGEQEIAFAETQWKQGKRTSLELFQQIVDTWHQISESLKDQVIDQFHGSERMNSVYLMAFSGARGNLSQVRQLVSMRGLMANPQGEIVGFPIISNFREGLTMTEYFISCYGARKGVIDTALRTADAGYLTRRLVDVAHNVIIRHNNCGTTKSIRLKSTNKGLSLAVRLVGRVAAESITLPGNKVYPDGEKFPASSRNILDYEDSTSPKVISLSKTSRSKTFSDFDRDQGNVDKSFAVVASKMHEQQDAHQTNKGLTTSELGVERKLVTKNQEITEPLAKVIATFRSKVRVRSPLTCITPVCQLCYGYALAENRRVSLGEAVGILAAQSLGEPGTQLTLRTFHTGGVFSGDTVNALYAPYEGVVCFDKLLVGDLVRTAQGDIAFLTSKKNTLHIFWNVDSSTHQTQQNTFDYLPEAQTTGSPSASFVHQQVQEGVPLVHCSEGTTEQGQPVVSPSVKSVDGQPTNDKKSLLGANNFSVDINTGTIVFIRHHQYVVKNQLLANFFSQQAKIRVSSEEQVFADFSGQVINLLPNMDFWIVAGVAYKPLLYPSFSCLGTSFVHRQVQKGEPTLLRNPFDFVGEKSNSGALVYGVPVGCPSTSSTGTPSCTCRCTKSVEGQPVGSPSCMMRKHLNTKSVVAVFGQSPTSTSSTKVRRPEVEGQRSSSLHQSCGSKSLRKVINPWVFDRSLSDRMFFLSLAYASSSNLMDKERSLKRGESFWQSWYAAVTFVFYKTKARNISLKKNWLNIKINIDQFELEQPLFINSIIKTRFWLSPCILYNQILVCFSCCAAVTAAVTALGEFKEGVPLKQPVVSPFCILYDASHLNTKSVEWQRSSSKKHILDQGKFIFNILKKVKLNIFQSWVTGLAKYIYKYSDQRVKKYGIFKELISFEFFKKKNKLVYSVKTKPFPPTMFPSFFNLGSKNSKLANQKLSAKTLISLHSSHVGLPVVSPSCMMRKHLNTKSVDGQPFEQGLQTDLSIFNPSYGAEAWCTMDATSIFFKPRFLALGPTSVRYYGAKSTGLRSKSPSTSGRRTFFERSSTDLPFDFVDGQPLFFEQSSTTFGQRSLKNDVVRTHKVDGPVEAVAPALRAQRVNPSAQHAKHLNKSCPCSFLYDATHLNITTTLCVRTTSLHRRCVDRRSKGSTRRQSAGASAVHSRTHSVNGLHQIAQIKYSGKLNFVLQKFVQNKEIPCVPLEHQKTLHCSTCFVAPGSLVNAGQELCAILLKSSHQKIKAGVVLGTTNESFIFGLHNLATSESGQVIKIDSNKVTLRRAHCYFVSSKGSLSVINNEYIRKGDGLFNLKYEKLLTGDIVQGLGKIEELLEYPKISLNLNFKTCLRRYLTKVSLDKAIEWSYADLQTCLVQSIQQVYVDQGCFISDKHLEIIVRQATCFGIILFPGDTGFLHHEVVYIDKIEKINKQLSNKSFVSTFFKTNFLKLNFNQEAGHDHPRVPVERGSKTWPLWRKHVDNSSKVLWGFGNELSPEVQSTSKQGLPLGQPVVSPSVKSVVAVFGQSPTSTSSTKVRRPEVEGQPFFKLVAPSLHSPTEKAVYYPYLKGISWNSLNSPSVLSAASFQETRRVLRNNLITNKVDFLKGIKERIILGELPEIGTGFFKNYS